MYSCTIISFKFRLVIEVDAIITFLLWSGQMGELTFLGDQTKTLKHTYTTKGSHHDS